LTTLLRAKTGIKATYEGKAGLLVQGTFKPIARAKKRYGLQESGEKKHLQIREVA